jgi:hypothetical protein
LIFGFNGFVPNPIGIHPAVLIGTAKVVISFGKTTASPAFRP